MRIEQKLGSKGSLKWIQIAVNEYSDVLDHKILSTLDLDEIGSIRWVSPLQHDQYAEYRDQSFVDKLDLLPLQVDLRKFWPRLGPQWDALGRTEKSVFLVEAKANIPEFNSPACGAGDKSMQLIKQSLAETQKYIGTDSCHDWTQKFYQYTNRIAHLYFLRVLNNMSAYLLFVDFINATEVNGPSTVEEWAVETMRAERILGIKKHHKLSAYIRHIYIDVNDFSG